MSNGSILASTAGPRLLRKGWPSGKVQERYTKSAESLIGQGVEFYGIQPDSAAAVETLVNKRVEFDSPYTMDSNAGGLRADLGGRTIGVMVLEGIEVPDDGIAVRVTAVAVEPDWEDRGVGSVLLGMIPLLVQPRLVYGGCDVGGAAFYQRAGFDVLAEGEMLHLPMGKGAAFKSSNVHYPHWFVRHW